MFTSFSDDFICLPCIAQVTTNDTGKRGMTCQVTLFSIKNLIGNLEPKISNSSQISGLERGGVV